MAFNVNDFRSELQYDGARPNLFQVEMAGIDLLGSNGTGATINPSGAAKKLTFLCRTAQLPGSTVNAVPLNYFGRELKFAGNRLFTEWTVTIINDEDFIVRNAMENWMNKINSHVSNKRELVGPTQYTTEAFVKQYAKNGDYHISEKTSSGNGKTYKFIGLFPIDITPIELDWGANDTIEEFAVTFAYQWWESNTTDAA